MEPTEKPEENDTFLLILSAILLALKRHAGLLSAAIASASNEHRLGASEAPPSIISAFLGAQLTNVLEGIVAGQELRTPTPLKKSVDVGNRTIDVKIAHLPSISRDATDRNRTSPFAFTGNKFEFRAVGSGQSPSFPVTMLNAAFAAALTDVTKMLKDKMGSRSAASKSEIFDVVQTVMRESQLICFEGDGYSEEWVREAERRGLLNLRDAPDAFKQLLAGHNVDMLVKRMEILNESELKSRFIILCEKYCNDLIIESKTVCTLLKQRLLPSTFKYRKDLAAGLSLLQGYGSGQSELKLLEKLNALSESLHVKIEELQKATEETEKQSEGHNGCHEERTSKIATIKVKPLLAQVRAIADAIEEELSDEFYPLPKYSELLFN